MRDSRNHTIEVTRKASSRTRKEHKVTLTVKQQAGVEDESIRTLINPSNTEPLRVDFHQLVRDWRVDLYRCGLRLTYDIVESAPGIDLLKTDHADWPSEAILFLLYSWLRPGLRQLLEAFDLVEDGTPFGGAFKLSQLLDMIGLDVALDDATVAALRARFTRTRGASP